MARLRMPKEIERRFWRLIGLGCSTESAAAEVGVAPSGRQRDPLLAWGLSHPGPLHGAVEGTVAVAEGHRDGGHPCYDGRLELFVAVGSFDHEHAAFTQSVVDRGAEC